MADKSRPMSIDAMLDMERKEVLALLESKAVDTGTSPERFRSASPYGIARSPMRGMLDIAEEPDDKKPSSPTRAPIRSMLDIDSPPPSPRPQVVRSMLDVEGPSSKHGSLALPNSSASPTEPIFKSSASTASSTSSHHRSMSDATFKPVDFGPRKSLGTHDRTKDYQFSGMLPSSNSQQFPKRNTTGKRLGGGGSSGSSGGGALGEALRGGDMSGLQLPNDRGRHSSLSGRLEGASKSPHGRLFNRNRSRSPATSLLGKNRYMTNDGQVVDLDNAYRRLSDANLAFSAGSLSQLPKKERSATDNGGRLIKDYLGPDGEHLGSSDEDDEPYSSDDEDRGRKMGSRSALSIDSGSGSRSRSRKGERKSLTLLAAAEQERTQVASTQPHYQYKSLIPEPEIKVTNSAGQTVKPAKNQVHPHTSFDQEPTSTAASAVGTDDEADVDDIVRAQKLSFSMTNVLSSPESHRAIRIIYRGEYSKIVQNAEEEHRRLRKYLVATDLSGESTHALEWAIGTVLRDGDTLIAIYCVDEETGIVTEDGALVPDDAKAMKEQAAVINLMANSRTAPASLSQIGEVRRPSALHFKTESSATPGSSPASGGRNERSKAEEERWRAVQGITDRVLRLLRKTRLQVRVVVEVLHCKNPKHLITEVIDLVNPTLVVIGSRGRSALKGVILGSFSNYLVTKSSVPVMVARKRLRKQSKYKKTMVRQVNNLQKPAARSLANAKID